MKTFASAARLGVLALVATGMLTGCKRAEAPAFSPAPGTYTGKQNIAMSTPTFGAAIVYTTDGSAPSCVKKNGTIYSTPVAVEIDTWSAGDFGCKFGPPPSIDTHSSEQKRIVEKDELRNVPR